MDVKFAGMVIDVSKLHIRNASLSIDVIVRGIAVV